MGLTGVFEPKTRPLRGEIREPVVRPQQWCSAQAPFRGPVLPQPLSNLATALSVEKHHPWGQVNRPGPLIFRSQA